MGSVGGEENSPELQWEKTGLGQVAQTATRLMLVSKASAAFVQALSALLVVAQALYFAIRFGSPAATLYSCVLIAIGSWFFAVRIREASTVSQIEIGPSGVHKELRRFGRTTSVLLVPRGDVAQLYVRSVGGRKGTYQLWLETNGGGTAALCKSLDQDSILDFERKALEVLDLEKVRVSGAVTGAGSYEGLEIAESSHSSSTTGLETEKAFKACSTRLQVPDATSEPLVASWAPLDYEQLLTILLLAAWLPIAVLAQWVLDVLFLILVSFGLMLPAASLSKLMLRQTLEASDTHIKVFGPGKRSKLDIPTPEVTQIFVEMSDWSVQLKAKMVDGPSIRLVRFFGRERWAALDVVLRLEQEIENHVGIREEPVAGAIPRPGASTKPQDGLR